MVAALAAVALSCDWKEATPRGGSRDYAREVDDVHARNQEIHERSQHLDQRLAALAPQVEELRRELAPLSVQWARDATVELDARLETAREKIAMLRAGTGADWQVMAGAAEEAVAELAETRDRVRADLEERSGAS
jgi:hypothetical protein